MLYKLFCFKTYLWSFYETNVKMTESLSENQNSKTSLFIQHLHEAKHIYTENTKYKNNLQEELEKENRKK